MVKLTYKEFHRKRNRILCSKNSNVVLKYLTIANINEIINDGEDYIELFLDIQKKESHLSLLPREIWETILLKKYEIDEQHNLNLILMFDKMITSELSSLQQNNLYKLNLYDFSRELIIQNHDKHDYKIELGIIRMDMGHYLKCCYDKQYKKFFFRLCGGDHYNYISNEKIGLTLNKCEDYDKYLYSYTELLDILIKHSTGCLDFDKEYNIKENILQCNM